MSGSHHSHLCILLSITLFCRISHNGRCAYVYGVVSTQSCGTVSTMHALLYSLVGASIIFYVSLSELLVLSSESQKIHIKVVWYVVECNSQQVFIDRACL